MKKVVWDSYTLSFAIANMDCEYDLEDFPYDVMSQAEEIRCEDVRGDCGCFTCEKNMKNPLMKKYRDLQYGGWFWWNTKEFLKAMAIKNNQFIRKCASTNTFCGCDTCVLIKNSILEKGIPEYKTYDLKYMDLEDYRPSYYWDSLKVWDLLGIRV